jgi:hypothetical protein
LATRLSQYRTVAPALVEQRAAERHRVLITRATVRKKGNPPIEAQLHDLSIYGCRLGCRSPHGAGDRIWLRIREDLPIAATVVWNDGQQLGCRFETPIERSLVRALTLVIC